MLRGLLIVLFCSLTVAVRGAEDSLEIRMRGLLGEVVIMETSDPVRAVPERLDEILLVTKKVELISVRSMPGNLVQNMTRQLFSRTPGVNVWESEGSGAQIGVAVRGLSPNRSWELDVRQNGYDIAADPFGYPEAYYSPPLEAVDEIMLIRGAASLQFGPQFGGLLDYRLRSGDTTRRLAMETMQTFGSFGLFNSYNAIGGQLGKWNYRISYHHRNGNGWRENAVYKMDHGYGRLAFKPSDRFEAALELTISRNRLQQPGGLTDSLFAIDPRKSYRSRNWLETPWNIAAVKINWKPTEQWSLSSVTSIQSAQRNSVGFTAAITVPDTVDGKNGSYANRQLDKDGYLTFVSELRSTYDYRLAGKSHFLCAGGRISQGEVDRFQKGAGSNGTDADFSLASGDALFLNELSYSTRNLALFAENAFHLGKAMTLTPGLRLEHLISLADGRIGLPGTTGTVETSEKSARTFLLAGIGWQWNLVADLTVRADIASAYRPVTYSQLTPSSTSDRIDENMQDASGYTAEIGFKGRVVDWLRFDINCYRLFYGNRIGTMTLENTDGTFYRYQTNLGNSVHLGLEAYLEASPFESSSSPIRSLRFFTSISYARARYQDYTYTKEVSGALQTVDFSGNRVEYAPQEIFRYGFSWSHQEFLVSFQGSHTGKVFTDANNTVAPSANGETGLLAAYDVFDFSGQWTFRSRYIVKASVNNLSDVRYGTRRAGGYPGRGLMPNEARTFQLTLGVSL